METIDLDEAEPLGGGVTIDQRVQRQGAEAETGEAGGQGRL
jgi:hypothetical protein